MTRRYLPSLLLPGRRLGRLVPVHQGRRARLPARRDDAELRLLARGADPASAFLCRTRGRETVTAEMRGAWREGLVLGASTRAIPFTLIAWGEKHIDSGVAAIGNASVPIFVALLAIPFAPSQRSTGLRLVGVLVGLVGVAILAGVDPSGGWWAVAGTLAVILSLDLLRRREHLAQPRACRSRGPVLAAASMLGGAAPAAAARARPSCRITRRGGRRSARVAALGDPRHGARAARPLPDAGDCTARRGRASSRT